MEKICVRTYVDGNQIDRTRSKLDANSDLIASYACIFKLAGNEIRMKILFALHAEERLCVCDLTDILGLTTPAVSQHLRKLKEGDLIESTKEAQRIYYNLSAFSKSEFSQVFEILSSNQPKNSLSSGGVKIESSSCCSTAST